MKLNDQQLEEMVAELTQVAVEEGEFEDEEFEAEDAFWVRRPPRAASSSGEVEALEGFLGRSLSPSYRHFLRLHDGWPECQRTYNLLGSVDYLDAEFRSSFATTIRIALDCEDLDVRAVNESFFYPENWYRFVDSKTVSRSENFPSVLYDVKDYLDKYQEEDSDLLLMPRHTLIGMSVDYVKFILLDSGTLRDDGEMDVVEYRLSSGSVLRVASF